MKIPSKSAGFSMIEVLIAVLILAIGLLGVAALQMASLTQGQESYFRSQATALAEDLASRIRAGRHAAKATAPAWGVPTWNDTPPGAVAAYVAMYNDSPYLCNVPPPNNCRDDVATGAAVSCNLTELVAFEQWDVCRQAVTLIPDGQVHVVTNNLRTTIAVSWLATEAREDTGEEEIRNPVCNEVFALAAARDCVVVEAIP